MSMHFFTVLVDFFTEFAGCEGCEGHEEREERVYLFFREGKGKQN